jgi:hypothetical protein
METRPPFGPGCQCYETVVDGERRLVRCSDHAITYRVWLSMEKQIGDDTYEEILPDFNVTFESPSLETATGVAEALHRIGSGVGGPLYSFGTVQADREITARWRGYIAEVTLRDGRTMNVKLSHVEGGSSPRLRGVVTDEDGEATGERFDYPLTRILRVHVV